MDELMELTDRAQKQGYDIIQDKDRPAIYYLVKVGTSFNWERLVQRIEELEASKA